MFTNIKDIIIEKNYKLKDISPIKIGGHAKYFIKCYTIKSLKKVLTICLKAKLNYKIVAGCSNLLFDDNGYNGAIIQFCKDDVKITKNKVFAYAGIDMACLINYTSTFKLSGLENFIGIPAKFGGAIKNNLGAFNSEIGSMINKVKILSLNKDKTHFKIKTKKIKSGDFSYRSCNFLKPTDLIISASLTLRKSTKSDINENLKLYFQKKSESQPLSQPSLGSVFKRDYDIIPAKIIDELNLKGVHVGGAEISKKHAGFIVNTGDATSKDVLELISLIKCIVQAKLNINLSCEIEYLGLND